MELSVSWQDGPNGPFGKDALGGKIVFPERGMESRICWTHRGPQPAILVRDTKPEEPRKGALIVRPGQCPACAKLARMATLLPGWFRCRVGNADAFRAPSGREYVVDVGRGCSPAEDAARGLIGQEENALSRERLTAPVLAILTTELVEAARGLPLPGGAPPEPAPAHKPEDSPFACVGDWVRRFGGHPAALRLVSALDRRSADRLFVNVRTGEYGLLSYQVVGEYLSEDERSTRSATVNRIESLAEDDHLREAMREAAGLAREAALAARSQAQAAYEAYGAALKAHPALWFEWWRGLTVAQRLRVFLEVCEYDPVKGVFVRRNKADKIPSPFTVEAGTGGVRVYYTRYSDECSALILLMEEPPK